jgi:hypothetical protein
MDWSWDDFTEKFKTNGEISYWKVAAGVAAFVAPVEVAVVSGVISAGKYASDYLADREKQAERRGEQRGEAKAKAEYSAKFEKLELLLKAEIDKHYRSARYFELVVALTAIGMACAACDGEVSHQERSDIEEFIGGTSVAALPADVRAKLDFLAQNPPNLATAFELVKQYRPDSMDLFDEVIRFVICSDGRISTDEVHFRTEWEILKQAA